MNISTMTVRSKGIYAFLLAFLFPLLAVAQQSVNINGLYYNLTSATRTAEVVSNPSGDGYFGAIDIPETVNYNGTSYTVTGINDIAFQNCYALNSVSVPKTVKTIGAKAFYNCMSMRQITLQSGLISIGNFAFYTCANLESLTLPNTVTTIGNEVFNNCIGLKTVTLSNNLTSMGYGAFYSCSSLTSVVIPQSLSEIPRNTFDGCRSMTSVTFNKKITEIGNNAFANCSSLRGVVMPNSLKKIGMMAFNNCSELTTVSVGSGIQTIGDQAFGNCPKLASFTIYASSVQNTSSTAFSNTNIGKCVLYVPLSGMSFYTTTQPWKSFYRIQEMEVPDYIYEVGNESNWNNNNQLMKQGNTNKYVGYYYLKSEFRIKPYEEWDEDYGYAGSQGRMEQGTSRNIPVPQEGFYRITVDLSALTYDLLLIESMSITGDFNKDGETDDSDMTFFTSTSVWMTVASFDRPTKVKFRANHNNYLNWGGTEANIVTGGDSLFVGVASYRFELYLSYDGNHYLKLTKLTDLQKAKKPTISFDKGELVFNSTTPNAEYNYTINVDDNRSGKGKRVALTSTYTISVYASAEGYSNSDVATATIGWRNGKPVMEGFDRVVLQDGDLKGDINEDGKLTVADITSIIALIAAQAEADDSSSTPSSQQ